MHPSFLNSINEALHLFYFQTIHNPFERIVRLEIEVTSVRQFTSICVFGGSNPRNKIEFRTATKHLGSVLTKKKIHLVYGGGSLGLMGCVSIVACIGGNQVLGIIPRVLTVRNLVGKIIREEIKVSSMHECIGRRISNSDAFIALSSGFGTL